MKILCVGKNYAKHAKEMGGATPSSPIWFWKPESSIIGDGDTIVLPAGIGEVHHEVELAVRIGKRARKLPDAKAARNCIDAFTVAIDCTARDLQQAAKDAGRPWAQAKGYDTFLPLGAWQEPRMLDLRNVTLQLEVNGEERQAASTREMTWDVYDLIYHASQWTTLEPGDILLTGTPSGVGPMQHGDTVAAHIVGQVGLTVDVMGEGQANQAD